VNLYGRVREKKLKKDNIFTANILALKLSRFSKITNTGNKTYDLMVMFVYIFEEKRPKLPLTGLTLK